MVKKKITGDDGKEYILNEKKPFYKRWWFILIAIIVVFGVALDGEEETTSEEVTEEEQVEVAEESKEEKEAAKKEVEKEKKEAKEKEAKEKEQSLAVDSYRDFMADNSKRLSNHFTDLSVQTNNATYTDLWIQETAAVVSGIMLTTQEAIDYDTAGVPAGYEEVHEAYVSSANKYQESMDYFVTGVDNMDPELLEKSSYVMDEGTKLMNKATELLRTVDSEDAI